MKKLNELLEIIALFAELVFNIIFKIFCFALTVIGLGLGSLFIICSFFIYCGFGFAAFVEAILFGILSIFIGGWGYLKLIE